MAGDLLNTIIPWILLIIGIIWVYSVFGEQIKRFIEWIKGFTSSNRERFQKQITTAKEFTYS
jgi:TM2 domain-containing membrane protein YozV